MTLLQFIKERGFFLYKDGTWYTSYKRDYRKKQTYYTDDEVLAIYHSEFPQNIEKKVRSLTDKYDLNGWEQIGARKAYEETYNQI